MLIPKLERKTGCPAQSSFSRCWILNTRRGFCLDFLLFFNHIHYKSSIFLWQPSCNNRPLDLRCLLCPFQTMWWYSWELILPCVNILTKEHFSREWHVVWNGQFAYEGKEVYCPPIFWTLHTKTAMHHGSYEC